MVVSLSTISRLLASPPSLYLSTTLRPPKTAVLSSKHSASALRLKHCHSPKPLRFSIAKSTTISATIAVGDKLPESTLSYLDSTDDIQTVTISDLTKGKKAVLFAIPGAFTSTCSQKHLPEFVEMSAELRSKGVDTSACISVNDAFVLEAWKEDLTKDNLPWVGRTINQVWFTVQWFKGKLEPNSNTKQL
ncbi:hypothetical protein TIFTF001_031488 [Ficus carica]|uniref:glutaredoxin-dependent peroxiredoxin n=1 Tax=Ficus carica TaxID=3494 RepID=A0AA88J581_FICCA|nr:hypothetical protein TIFTF001_031488 [Ficus carica]